MTSRNLLNQSKFWKYLLLILFLLNARIGISQDPYRQFNDDIHREVSNLSEDLGKVVTDRGNDRLKSGRYFAMGAGFGEPYGSCGFKALMRFRETFACFGLSAGLGFSPDGNNKHEDVSSTTLWTLGLQMYIGQFYLDYQFGQVARMIDEQEEKNVLGWSFFIGYNWFIYKNWGINFSLGGVMPVTWNIDDGHKYAEWETLLDDFSRFDWGIGILYKIPY